MHGSSEPTGVRFEGGALLGLIRWRFFFNAPCLPDPFVPIDEQFDVTQAMGEESVTLVVGSSENRIPG